MQHLHIKVAILEKFPTQADFALMAKTHESRVSQVIRGRKKLGIEEAKKWAKVLDCDVNVLESVTVKADQQ